MGKNIHYGEIISQLSRLILSITFLYSGFVKAIDIEGTKLSVYAYEFFNYQISSSLAYVLVAVEIILGLMLLIGLKQRLASLGIFVLLTIFIIGISSAWMRGLSIDCGCFGYDPERVPYTGMDYLQVILRDILLMLLCLMVIFFTPIRLTLDEKMGSFPSRDSKYANAQLTE